MLTGLGSILFRERRGAVRFGNWVGCTLFVRILYDEYKLKHLEAPLFPRRSGSV